MIFLKFKKVYAKIVRKTAVSGNLYIALKALSEAVQSALNTQQKYS